MVATVHSGGFSGARAVSTGDSVAAVAAMMAATVGVAMAAEAPALAPQLVPSSAGAAESEEAVLLERLRRALEEDWAGAGLVDECEEEQGADAEAPRELGRWVYGPKALVYEVQARVSERETALWFKGPHSKWGTVSGRLRPNGEWLQAVLTSPSGDLVGQIRLAYEEADGSMRSNYQAWGRGEWGKDTVASRASSSDEAAAPRQKAVSAPAGVADAGEGQEVAGGKGRDRPSATRAKAAAAVTAARRKEVAEKELAERLIREAAAPDALGDPRPALMTAVYTAPLEFVVVSSVVARLRPSSAAPQTGKLSPGEEVSGWKQGRWLKLREGVRSDDLHGWVLVDGEEGESDAAAAKGKTRLDSKGHPALRIPMVFSEAAILEWDPVPAAKVEYKVEWATKEEPKDVRVPIERESMRRARVHGLPPDTMLRFRLTARVLTDSPENGGEVFAELVSAWEEAETDMEIDAMMESNLCLDPLANFRGRCMDCSCRGFVLSEQGSTGASSRDTLEDLVCRRCSCSCVRHFIVGEFQYRRGPAKSNPNLKALPGTTPASVPAAREPERAAPEAPRELPAPSAPPAPLAPPEELPDRAWRPEDAGDDADRVKFVLDKVASAQTLYETIGVDPLADDEAIRRAFRQVSLNIHPDKVQHRGDDELRSQAEAAFKIISSAYEVLGDASRRAVYDRTVLRSRGVVATRIRSSRSNLTALSFLKRFLGKNCSFGWDLSAKPPGDQWEDRGGGQYGRSTKIHVHITHAISGEELKMSLEPGTTLGMLKKAIVEQVKRGPVSRIELATRDGADLADGYHFSSSVAEALVLVGIPLGPPKDVVLCLCHASTGARARVTVPDTSTIAEVREAALKKFPSWEASRVRFGMRGSNREHFQELEDDELLNGREQMLVTGVEIVMKLTRDEAVELQNELLESYGADWFQERLDDLVEDFPPPGGLLEPKFKEGFANLLRVAQQATLVKHGFDGTHGVYNMMHAFSEVGADPAVVALAQEIDAKLRVTDGCVVRLAAELVLEAVEPPGGGFMPSATLRAYERSTFGELREAIAARFKGEASGVRLFRACAGGTGVEEAPDGDIIGKTRRLKVTGVDLSMPEEPRVRRERPRRAPLPKLEPVVEEVEKRTADDGMQYTYEEFKTYFGKDADRNWKWSGEQEERRRRAKKATESMEAARRAAAKAPQPEATAAPAAPAAAAAGGSSAAPAAGAASAAATADATAAAASPPPPPASAAETLAQVATLDEDADNGATQGASLSKASEVDAEASASQEGETALPEQAVPPSTSPTPEQEKEIAAPSFRCPECAQSFDSEHALAMHMKYIHKPLQEEEAERQRARAEEERARQEEEAKQRAKAEVERKLQEARERAEAEQARRKEEAKRREREALEQAKRSEADRRAREAAERDVCLPVLSLGSGGHSVELPVKGGWPMVEVRKAVARTVGRPEVLEYGRLVRRRRADGALSSLGEGERVNAVLAEGDEVILMNASLEPNPDRHTITEEDYRQAESRRNVPGCGGATSSSSSAPRRANEEGQKESATLEIRSIHSGRSQKVQAPPTATALEVKELFAEALGRPEVLATKLLRRNTDSSGYTSFQDDEVVGCYKLLFIMNVDLEPMPGSPIFLEEQAAAATPLAANAPVVDPHAAATFALGSFVRTARGTLLRVGEDLKSDKLQDVESGQICSVVEHGAGRRLRVELLPRSGVVGWLTTATKTEVLVAPVTKEEAEEQLREPELVMITIITAGAKSGGWVELFLMSSLSLGEVKKALSDKLQRPDILTKGRFVQRKGASSFAYLKDDERLGPRRDLSFMGADLP